jgi:hypothetical protein
VREGGEEVGEGREEEGGEELGWEGGEEVGLGGCMYTMKF